MSCRNSRSSRRSLFSACLRSSISVPVAYHRMTLPLSSSKGLYRIRNHRYLPSFPRARCSFSNGTEQRDLSAALREVSERLLDGTSGPGSYRRALRPETAPCTQVPCDLHKWPCRRDSKPRLFGE